MKVLIVNKHIFQTIGGSEMQCDIIARGLINRGHSVIYGTPSTLPVKGQPGQNLPYQVDYFDLENVKTVQQFLLAHKPDIIYWRFNKHFLNIIVPTAKTLQIPFVFAVSHINDVTKFAFKSKKLKGITGRFKSIINIWKQKIHSARQYQYFNYVAGLTSLNSEFLGKVGVPKQRLIRNAVPTGIIDFHWDRPFIVWISSIKASKRPEAFIELAKSCRELELDFLMIGPIQQQAYEKPIYEASKMPNFHYLGSKNPDEVNGVLSKAYLLINTCEPEGFGNNFIQAWMFGCPSISLSFDPDGIIEKQQLGFVSGTEKQMEADVRKLYHNETLRNEMGDMAKLYAQENFSQEGLAKEVEAFLLEILNENSLHR
ncbi:glycosyltransferase family 4 protein [Arthrospiribacter ruber]|uniref:Glycosyltransferase family 1 protein n=1 Tax=Arthrospiribacter ruber TaxID=2487934 RepID=A0A951IQQ3_9BACT|nr:glycosyltransferase family 4 protein [Arthrospiribacter ruber]MBW3466350.1 glycosyltransferase family 1 protein [Arthrospiribacter ruber]